MLQPAPQTFDNKEHDDARIRLAIDIGGTFTDVVLDARGERFVAKVLTTPIAPEEGFIRGALRACEVAGVDPAAIDLIVHGTTLATNALIERKGAKVALIATDGFRDILEIAYEHRFEQSDLFMQRPAPLVPRHHRFGIPERIAADGSVLVALEEQAVSSLISTLEKENFDAIAVGLLHSYVNPAHEERVRELISARLPDISISISSEVSPEIREYDRISTTVANAYVQPMMARYLGRLQALLREAKFQSPLLLMMSSGAVTTLETAQRYPVRLVESGPAGGAILANEVAQECKLDKILSFDMGGTTAKICFIEDGRPQISRSFEVARQYRHLKGSGLPLRIPVIEMVEIGAGGGSIASVDALRRVTVGPQSAGSEPGPACYGRGGDAATVTDADLITGRLNPAYFAGGQIRLDSARAERAMQLWVGEKLAFDQLKAAMAVTEIVDENMANAARVHCAESGKDFVGRAMVAFGGAAPLHAARVAEKLGIDKIVIPVGAGVGSAIGFLRAGVAYEVVRSRYMDLATFDVRAANDLFIQMRGEAEPVVRAGEPDAELSEVRHAYMRYKGQGHEIAVALPNRDLITADQSLLIDRFVEEYQRLYGRAIPNLTPEIMTWSLALRTPSAPVRPVSKVAPLDAPNPIALHDFMDQGVEKARAPIFARNDLRPGHTIEGPALITESETSIFVSSRFRAEVNAVGHIVLTRRGVS